MYPNDIKQKGQNGLVSILGDKIKGTGLACLLGLTACSTASVSQPVTALSVEPVEEVLGPTAEQLAVMPAEYLLEMGKNSFKNKEYKSSIDFFNAAIDTDRLNEEGMALSYWHLGLAYYEIGDKRGGEALDGFITIAKGLIEERDKLLSIECGDSDFVEYFDLPAKLRFAQLSLNAVWSREASYFGRSLQNPIPVQDQIDIEYFLKLAIKCPYKFNGTLEELQDDLYHVVINCESKEFNDEFYFKIDSED